MATALQVFSSPSGVWYDLANCENHLKALEAKVTQDDGILTDHGTEYCGRAAKHSFQLFMARSDD